MYIDDLTSYSKDGNDHYMHLEKVFCKALDYGISLNPWKCTFGVSKGKLLWKFVGKEGVRIDLERIDSIDKIQKPKNVKGI